MKIFIRMIFIISALLPLAVWAEEQDSGATPISTVVGTAGGQPSWR